MTSNEPSSRTWGRRRGARTLGVIGTTVVCVALLAVLPLVVIGTGGGVFAAVVRCVVAVAIVLGVVTAVTATLREAHRVVLEPDGTLELVRPLGSVRIPIEQIRSVSLHPYEDSPGIGPIELITDRGVYRVHRRLLDVRGFVRTLRERNPRIEVGDA